MSMSYGQTIYLNNGYVSTDGHSCPEQATEDAVRMAIHSGWKPRRWWQFWHPPCPEHVREEYERQTTTSV